MPAVEPIAVDDLLDAPPAQNRLKESDLVSAKPDTRNLQIVDPRKRLTPPLAPVGQPVPVSLMQRNFMPVGGESIMPSSRFSPEQFKALPTAEKALMFGGDVAGKAFDVARTPFTWETFGLGSLAAKLFGATVAPVVSKAVSAAFAGQMTAEGAKKAGELVTEMKKPEGQRDERKISDLGSGLLIDAGFTGAAAAHAALPKTTPAQTLAKAIDKSPVAMKAVVEGARILPQSAKAVVETIVKKPEKEVPSASKEPSAASVSEPEIRPSVGQEAPLRQPGEAAQVQEQRPQDQAPLKEAELTDTPPTAPVEPTVAKSATVEEPKVLLSPQFRKLAKKAGYDTLKEAQVFADALRRSPKTRENFPEAAAELVKEPAPSKPARVGKGVGRFKKIETLRQEAGLPPDAIEFLQQVINPSEKIHFSDAEKIREGFNPSPQLKRYFTKKGESGGSPLDKVAQSMEQFGITGDEDLLEKLEGAATAREKFWRDHIKNVAPPVHPEQAQYEDWVKAVKKGGKEVATDDLKTGDVLDVEGEHATVVDVNEEGVVTVEDGRKFGVQTLQPGTKIYVENVQESPPVPWEPIDHITPVEPVLELAKPESVEEATARQKTEAESAEAKRLENERLERQATKEREARAQATKRLGGDLGSAGQGGLFAEPGQQEIFQPKPPGIISMGGLAPGDPLEPVGKNKPGQTVGYGADIYGVAERVRDERTKAGQVTEVVPGEGIGAQESVEHGRELLTSGVDPEKVLSTFEKTKKLSADDMAVVRAKGEELAKAARSIEGKFGTHSPEYKMAWDALSSWDTRSKTMQTEWHKAGMAQQGETDLDTGTFTGLQRAYKEVSGKDFTPKQAGEAKQIATANKEADVAAQKAKEKLYEEASKPIVDQKVKSLVERVLAMSHKQADASRARLKARAFTFSAGLDPTVLADVAIIGADHILTGAVDFTAWSKKMIDEFGDKISPHLKEIFDASDQEADRITNKTAGPEAPKVKAARTPATPKSLDEIRKVMATHKPGTPFSPEQVSALWQQAKGYIGQGIDNFDDIRNKLATDLGLKVEDATRGLTQSKNLKRAADEMWMKQKLARQLRETAKRWVKDQETPGYLKAIRFLPSFWFANKVRFHGTVALGTHAPMLAYQPQYWARYLDNYKRMYRMVGSDAYYEQQMQDLVRRPNFALANRAGLINDPFDYEEFDSPETHSTWSKLYNIGTETGKRGYSVLKTLRQDVFDQRWEALPDTAKIPEVAKALADSINHVTGVTQARAPRGLNNIFFAPRLWGSRAAWLTVDPARSVKTFVDWKNASEAEKQFAIHQVKEKATVLATAYSLLALNQAFLSATGSKQKINLTDPMKGDFMKFKAAGMQFSYGNQFLTMARLPLRLWAIRQSEGGKLKGLVYPDESTYNALGEYARSQFSPFSSLTMDLWTKADWMGRQLPNSNRPEPKRLRAEGVKPYTWPEFWAEQALPIPAEEAMREVWRGDFKMNDAELKQLYKAMATISVMTATGARLNEDWSEKK